MQEWLTSLSNLKNKQEDCVLVTVAHTAGSAPRESGTKMIVTAGSVYGTIGGGNLEHTAIQTARSFLLETLASNNNVFFELYALGPMLEQCCGGAVFLHYECVHAENSEWMRPLTELAEHAVTSIVVTHGGRQDSSGIEGGKLIVTEFETAGSIGELDEYAIGHARRLLCEGDEGLQSSLHSLSEAKGSLPDIEDALFFDVLKPCDFNIALFGAGHVGKAVVDVLEKSVDCKITWVDSRAELFPTLVPENVTVLHSSMPTSFVHELPANCYYLVMTHSHELDQALCEAILTRDDFRFLGLIGSETKKRRFHKRLLEKGFSEQALKGLTCPIGVDGIHSKEPGSIAVSLVAQLLQLYELNKNVRDVSPTNHNIISL